MHVAFLLDFFQPSAQGLVIDEVSNECYLPLIDLFNSDLAPRFTVSLANSFAGMLAENGKDDLIKGLGHALDDRKIELVHTGAFHSIFPLIPIQEVRRQIELDIRYKSEHFGLETLGGIVPPELCYADELVSLYRDMGFSWTIIDDRVMEMNGVRVPDNEIFHVSQFAVLMRSSFWSDRLRRPSENGTYPSGREFVRQLEREVAGRNQDCYKIIALSAETFGHHVKYYEETLLRNMLFEIEKSNTVRLCLVSDLLKTDTLVLTEKSKEKDRTFSFFPPTSWATQPENYQRGDWYPHWKSRGNPIHEKLWELTNLIFDACRDINFQNDAHSDLRSLLDRAFYSTQYFWASIWFWNPEQIYDGIDLQMRALYKCARLTRNLRMLNRGELIYTALLWAIDDRARRETGSRS
jgi:hypothetical protein